jgi:hypothetical protein
VALAVAPGGGVALSQSPRAPTAGEASPETLDRVVASIGDEAVTGSDVNREWRLERFLNGQMAKDPPDPKTIDQIRERLVERRLLSAEAATETGIENEARDRAEKQLEETRKRFSTPEAYQAALHLLGMDEGQVLTELVAEQKVLGMIDRRLRPEAVVEPVEIETYYRETFTPEFKRWGTGTLPPLPEVEGQIREILTQQRIDSLLAQWLEELKSSHRVVYHSY